jgi:hypothetical protein
VNMLREKQSRKTRIKQERTLKIRTIVPGFTVMITNSPSKICFRYIYHYNNVDLYFSDFRNETFFYMILHLFKPNVGPIYSTHIYIE